MKKPRRTSALTRLTTLAVVVGLVLAAACDRSDKGGFPDESNPRVFVSNAPLRYAVERLAGADVEILWLVPDGDDPAFWEPTATDIRTIQSADLLLFNGAGYERWARGVTIDETLVVDTSAVFAENYIETAGGPTHSHGDTGAHSHGDIAFTTWLDLTLYGLQAAVVHHALRKLLPDETDSLDTAWELLEEDILAADRSLTGAVSDLAPQPFLASHPVYQYFSRRYLPEITPVLWEPDVFQEEEEWEILEDLRRETGATFMLWEDQPLPETTERLDEMGVFPVIVTPAFGDPPGVDFLERMRGNAARLEVLKGK